MSSDNKIPDLHGDVARKWLVERGFTGLYSDECGCSLKELAPCSGPFGCSGGYVRDADEDARKEGWDFTVGPDKPEEDTNG